MANTRLTPFAKFLIVFLVVGGIVFLAKDYIPALSGEQSSDTTEQVTDNHANDTQQQDNQQQEEAKKPEPAKRVDFTYAPPAPVDGKMKGVVELGASGFNSFIVTIDKSKNWKLEKAEWGNSLVYDGMSSAADIRKGLKSFIGDMLDYGVAGRDIHFVVSSGALKVDETKKIIKELKGMGYVVNTVTPEQEGKYALAASLPKVYNNSAFMVDIGSGNTKISWVDGDVKSKETNGAKYYKDNVADSDAYQNVRSAAAAVPEKQRSVCFLLGGVPFGLAKEVREGKERFTVLKAPEDYEVEGAKMKAGLNIYNAIKDATGCETFVFDWEGNFTIGFLLSTK